MTTPDPKELDLMEGVISWALEVIEKPRTWRNLIEPLAALISYREGKNK